MIKRVVNDRIITMDGTKILNLGLELVNGMRFNSGCSLMDLILDQRKTTCLI